MPSAWLALAAMYRGDSRWVVAAFTSAPASSSSCMQRTWPFSAATCKGLTRLACGKVNGSQFNACHDAQASRTRVPAGDGEHGCENLTHRCDMSAYRASYNRIYQGLSYPRVALGAGTVAEKQLHHIARVALAGVVKSVVVFLQCRAQRPSSLLSNISRARAVQVQAAGNRMQTFRHGVAHAQVVTRRF